MIQTTPADPELLIGKVKEILAASKS